MNTIKDCHFIRHTSPDPKQVKVVTDALLEIVAANTQIAKLITKVGKPPRFIKEAPMLEL